MFKCRLKVYLSLPAPPATIPPETSAEAAALDEADRAMEKDFYSIAEALSCKALKNTYYNGYIIKGGELKAEAWIDFAAGDLEATGEAVKVLLEAQQQAKDGTLADRLWLNSRIDRIEFLG